MIKGVNKSGFIVEWKFLGATLAQRCDEEQADFFKAFIKECLSWGTALQVEQQLASVNLKLTDEEREVLKMLGYKDGDQ